MTTLLRWHSKLSKRRKAAAVTAAQAAGYPESADTGAYLAIPHERTDTGPLWIFVLLREEGEVLRGAYLEMGAALAAGVPVWYIGEDDGSITKNAAIRRAPTIDEAFWRIFEAFGLPDPFPRHWPFPPPHNAGRLSPIRCPGGGREISGLLATVECPACGLLIQQKDVVYGRPGIRMNNMWLLPEHQKVVVEGGFEHTEEARGFQLSEREVEASRRLAERQS